MKTLKNSLILLLFFSCNSTKQTTVEKPKSIYLPIVLMGNLDEESKAVITTLLIRKGYAFESMEIAREKVSQETRGALTSYISNNEIGKNTNMDKLMEYVNDNVETIYKTLIIDTDTTTAVNSMFKWQIRVLPYNKNAPKLVYEYQLKANTTLADNYLPIIDSIDGTMKRSYINK